LSIPAARLQSRKIFNLGKSGEFLKLTGSRWKLKT